MTGPPSAPSVEDVRSSTALDIGMRVGLMAYGAVHLLFAGIALQLAWTSSSTRSQGALHGLAENVLGQVVLWVAAAGLVLLAVWQGAEAAAGYGYREGAQRIRRRLESGGRAVVYLALAWLAASTAAGIAGGSSEDGLTARLMSVPAGQLLVAAVGLVTLGIGIAQAVKGLTKRFTDDLEAGGTSGPTGTALVRLGQVGYVAKGVALGLVGGMFVWAAWTYDPTKAGGLDEALRVVLDQPYGRWLLSLFALGLAAFGGYCFGWAHHARS